jgi:hypothetical protein
MYGPSSKVNINRINIIQPILASLNSIVLFIEAYELSII